MIWVERVVSPKNKTRHSSDFNRRNGLKRPLMPFQHIFSFSERKLDISNFAGKLLTVYNMTGSRLKISSSPPKTEKKVHKVL
jgi:hypothetical protein